MKDARKLDTRISIYHWVAEADAELGTDEKKRTLLRTCWADVAPRTASLMTGRDAGTMLAKTTHAIMVRLDAIKDVTNDCEIEWFDTLSVKHVMDIDYILPPTRRDRFFTIYCTEEV